MEMVEFYEVTKKYGRVEALRNASFKIPGKSVTALLGPNCAGKTTSMKLIMGFSKPTRCKVLVWGDGAVETRGLENKTQLSTRKTHIPTRRCS